MTVRGQRVEGRETQPMNVPVLQHRRQVTNAGGHSRVLQRDHLRGWA